MVVVLIPGIIMMMISDEDGLDFGEGREDEEEEAKDCCRVPCSPGLIIITSHSSDIISFHLRDDYYTDVVVLYVY